MKDAELTQEVVRELLDYNPETGIMTWKERDRKWFKSDGSWKCWNSGFVGREAGTIGKNKGYDYEFLILTILGRRYRAHRVVWLWMKGEWPKDQVDHINRNATDNRWRNLREVTPMDNSRNSSKRKNNTSGFTGVTWDRRKAKWKAQVRRYHRGNHFLGYFAEDDLESAVKAVQDFRREHGFSEDHGKEYAHYYKGDSE